MILLFIRNSRYWLTLSTLSNYNGLFQSLFWFKLKRPVGVNGLKASFQKAPNGDHLSETEFRSVLKQAYTCTSYSYCKGEITKLSH